jgi:hypothetical protein
VLTNQNARAILCCIALFLQDSDLHDSPKLSSASFSVEHIMPRKWETYWSEGRMGANAKQQRDRTILTLGNLTLVTKRLNSKLKNDPWATKRNTLRDFSSLRMTTKYLDLDEWGEQEIKDRSTDLSVAAIEIWK